MRTVTTNTSILYLGLLEDGDIELNSAALALSALDHEGVDLAPYLDQLRTITHALDIARRAQGDAVLATGAGQGAVLAAIIGGELGFAGDSESYDAPLNADMIRVLDRKRGLPVSLAILYVAAARRLGWKADALNTPSHVLVAIGPAASQAFIDPFHGGAPVSPARLTALFERATGPGEWAAQNKAEPMSNRMTLVRLLRNQAIRAEQETDIDRACTVYQRMTIVAPDHGHGWWHLARLQLILGRIEEARTSLSAMLEVTRDPQWRGHIRQTLIRLSASEG